MNKLTIHPSPGSELAAWCYLAFQQLALPHLVAWLNRLLSLNIDLAGLNFVVFSINFVAAILIFGKYLWRHGVRFALNPLPFLIAAAKGFVVYLIANSLYFNLIIQVFPNFANVNDQTITGIFADHYFLMALSTCLLAPVAEELLHRGLVFRALYRKSPVLGYVVSALLFSAIHVTGYIGRFDSITLLICYIQYIPGALVLAASYAKTDCIFVPILIHMAINLMATLSVR